MMAGRNLTAADVLERILALDSEDSGDDSQHNNEGEAEPQQRDPISSDESEEEEETQQNVEQAVKNQEKASLTLAFGSFLHFN